MSDAEPEATFGTIAQALNDFRFAYLHIVNRAAPRSRKAKRRMPRGTLLALIRKKYRGTLIVAGTSIEAPRKHGSSKARRI